MINFSSSKMNITTEFDSFLLFRDPNQLFDYLYRKVWVELGDPRVAGLFLADSPWGFVLISICYVIFAFRIGPKLMKNQTAFDLRDLLLFYNGFQVSDSLMQIKC